MPIKKKRRENEIEVNVAKVTRHDGPGIILPDDMSIPQAIDALEYIQEYEETEVDICEAVEVLPYDGAQILQDVLDEQYGCSRMVAKPTWFGPEPPQLISVQTGPNRSDTKQVAWGQIALPGVEGRLETSFVRKDGFVFFALRGNIKRKYEKDVKAIADKVRERVTTHSIYFNRAVRAKFLDSNGDMMPHPQITFFDVENVNPQEAIYSSEVDNAIRDHIHFPIEHPNACSRLGVPTKRGILLYGSYGTGKTLAARVAAKLATENDWTFVYVEDTQEFTYAIRFARYYGRCVIFAEDIDRITSGERTTNLDQILNTLDGIDTKSQQLIAVLTTNHVDTINKAMMRPGRLDAVIEVGPPDAYAAERLLRQYSRGRVASDEDLTEAAQICASANMIPSCIQEVAERAKLSAARLAAQAGTLGDTEDLRITSEAMSIAAKEMCRQADMMKPKPGDDRTDVEKLGEIIGRHISASARESNKKVDLEAIEALLKERGAIPAEA